MRSDFRVRRAPVGERRLKDARSLVEQDLELLQARDGPRFVARLRDDLFVGLLVEEVVRDRRRECAGKCPLPEGEPVSCDAPTTDEKPDLTCTKDSDCVAVRSGGRLLCVALSSAGGCRGHAILCAEKSALWRTRATLDSARRSDPRT